MTVQKFINYCPLDTNGKSLNSSQELRLNVLENSGNYLLHKDLLRHFNSQRQGMFQQKPEVKFVVADANHGNKKGRGVHEQVLIGLHYGKVVVLFLVQNQRRFL